VTAGLAGRHAVVTGGGRGIGAAVAEALARAGAAVSVMGRTRAPLDAQARRLESAFGARAFVAELDVTDAAAVERGFADAARALGPVHVLVNNAGQAEGAAFTETTRALWDRLLAVNLTSAFLCAQQVVPGMIAAKSGRIVNIASTAGLRGVARITAYTASKHGLIGLTRALAAELAKLGITVNAVCPGYTDTEMTERTVRALAAGTGRPPDDAARMLARSNAIGRLVHPAEVAATVAWLCSEEAGGITGQSIVVGGET
jgi:NAD(P)-dependent dehydrogenase (short-subunit alcohol dehydrogenase family)